MSGTADRDSTDGSERPVPSARAEDAQSLSGSVESTSARVVGERALTGQVGRAAGDDARAEAGLVQQGTSRREELLEQRVRRLETEVEQLRCAMAHRAPIEQAKGILTLLCGVDQQVAFEMLAYISSTTHRKVRDVATAITEAASGRGGLPVDVQRILCEAWPPGGRSLPGRAEGDGASGLS